MRLWISRQPPGTPSAIWAIDRGTIFNILKGLEWATSQGAASST
jgi:hypothetical protein